MADMGIVELIEAGLAIGTGTCITAITGGMVWKMARQNPDLWCRTHWFYRDESGDVGTGSRDIVRFCDSRKRRLSVFRFREMSLSCLSKGAFLYHPRAT
ncbi:hypothetical protein SBX64_06075 [Vibrio rhizosphaerae]|uniref:Uncharacterized protein n=1 Tax=Vibrio rhizosphaerae TaxID=398736 RepID=A0ABU4IT30_9VIBR|nr:hypothetical protein [Vibrio rhizosphaerae]MDW6092108.1 hypothetical protein [Vibrio rhizosphaerae]